MNRYFMIDQKKNKKETNWKFIISEALCAIAFVLACGVILFI